MNLLKELDGFLREYQVDLTDAGRSEYVRKEQEVTDGSGNLYSSEIRDALVGDDQHLVLLDLDCNAALIPSTTDGHHHLYIDKELTWDQLERLLTVLEEVGIIEPGFARLSRMRKATFLRKPGVKKTKRDVSS